MIELLEHLYGAEALDEQKSRYEEAVRKFSEKFTKAGQDDSMGEPHIFRAPGRTEIGGNHTDHQNGQVLATAIDMDIIAVAAVGVCAVVVISHKNRRF